MAFQTFDPPPNAADDIARRVRALRERFADLGVDGVIVPHEDAYQNEYLPPSEERLAFISGFTGSAGHAVVLGDSALLATDGRYALQAERQVPAPLYTIASTPEEAKAFLKDHLCGMRLGYDPNVHTRASVKRLREAAKDLLLVALDDNPIDAIWTDRPAWAHGRGRPHPPQFAGRTPAQKLVDVRSEMVADALLIAASDTVCWLLNWRGTDVAHTPLVLCRAFVPKDGPVTVFVDPESLPRHMRDGLGTNIRIAPPDAYPTHLTELSQGLAVRADPAAASEAALTAIEAGGALKTGEDLANRLKVIKNPAEIEGMRAAHLRDGLAMTRFLAWFEHHAVGLTEIDLAERLEAMRCEEGAIDIAFDTIAGAGPHGAIVHYRVDRSTNRTVADGDPVLIDSGGQYEDGTTDITRTLVAGTPTDEFRTQFTRVLKGHIAIAQQRFPQGATGAELDTLARAHLWNAGFDYAHGTGHGVGAALSVHEGPAGISKRSRTALAPGMIVSNEPGYYREGAYGIRIENLLLVAPPSMPLGGEKEMLRFETLTLVPIDTRLVVPQHLTPGEIGWLDNYHGQVRGALCAHLTPAEHTWLEARCRPIADKTA